jgi:hypothetical protein
MKKYLYVALLAFGVILLSAPPVMAQDDKPFVIHGEFRFRGEYTANDEDLNDNTDDSALYWPYRARIAAEGKFGKNIGVWIEFQNAAIAGDSPGGGPFTDGIGNGPFNGGDAPELYQANITIDNLWSDNFNVRIGRQEIVAGNELFLGDLDFYSGVFHDGMVGNWNFKKWNLMFWYTRPDEDSVDSDDAPFPPDLVNVSAGAATTHFVGGYATWAWKKQSFDVYLMNLNSSGPGLDVQTLGVRWARPSESKGLFWSAEFAKQTGDVSATTDADGSVFEGWVGWNINNKHSVHAKLLMASGDEPGAADFEGFIPLFGDFHNRAGRGDWFRLDDDQTNISGSTGTGGLEAISVGYTGKVSDKIEWGAAYWQYTVAETAPGAFDDLGQAIDVYINHNYSRNLSFTASLSQLSVDDALTGGTPPDDDVTRLYAQARLRF